MKGFMIYETPLWGDEENVVYVQEVIYASYTLKQVGSDDITCYLEGIAKDPVKKATCNKDDTYDFEIGALIALMKKCGLEKSAMAYAEIFDDTAYGDALIENKRLKEKVDNLYTYNKDLVNEIDQKNHEIISLKALKLTNESLKKDNESFRKSLEKLKEENEHLINARDLLINKNNELKEKNKELHKNIDELFESEQHSKTELGRLYFEKYRHEEKVEKLKLDCEKLRHGYIELPRTLDINGTVYRKSIQIKDFGEQINKLTVDSLIEESRAFTRKCIDEWLYGPPTKREEMWDEIFALHKENDVIIKVKKEDVNTFLHEIENRIPEITWNSCVKIFETKYTIGNIYGELKIRDTIYFRLSKETTLSYSSDPDIYRYRELKHIDYLPPMRWDLFNKGRKIIRVNADKLDEFMRECSINLGCIIKPNLKSYKEFTHVFVMISDYHYDNKPTIHIMSPYDLASNQFENSKKYSDKKIVNWEDVR